MGFTEEYRHRWGFRSPDAEVMAFLVRLNDGVHEAVLSRDECWECIMCHRRLDDLLGCQVPLRIARRLEKMLDIRPVLLRGARDGTGLVRGDFEGYGHGGGWGARDSRRC